MTSSGQRQSAVVHPHPIQA